MYHLPAIIHTIWIIVENNSTISCVRHSCFFFFHFNVVNLFDFTWWPIFVGVSFDIFFSSGWTVGTTETAITVTIKKQDVTTMAIYTLNKDHRKNGRTTKKQRGKKHTQLVQYITCYLQIVVYIYIYGFRL